MDWISELPEDLLLRILSSLSAKDVAATMVLSKRWKFLWMLVPKLIYDEDISGQKYESFSRFVTSSLLLLLQKAPHLQTVHFKVVGDYSRERDVDIGEWATTVVKSGVRELIIETTDLFSRPVTLPESFYTCCKMLVTLKLSNVVLLDVSCSFSLPSLKSLSLLSVKYQYPGDEIVKTFLSSCHVLEDLHVELCLYDNVTVFAVRVPSLKSLSLHTDDPDSDSDSDEDGGFVIDEDGGFVIDAPSLECLDIHDHSGEFCIIENDMPKIVTASFDVSYSVPANILGSITSVKHLDLCLVDSEYPLGSVFHSLVHLKICTCHPEWLELLMCLLRSSPNLQALRMDQHHHELWDEDSRPSWIEPSSVPECVSSSLQTLWVDYKGTDVEKEMVAYMLRNANCLKKATISSVSIDPCKKIEMVKELSSLSRCSSTCHLIFD
ncbi:unnamed protein product [Microthlaspi erraticum]|uniref:F-box domain-containing protein n=1 Tax=Microthlaspi erraticum TaxID=1685480 RepID=A0A6D2L6K9_9BRAS|nr:unnamed protein product [Microthlaspi erraticum]